MELINNITKTLRDDLSVEIKDGSKLSIAAACFSIYAFQALKEQLLDIDEFQLGYVSHEHSESHHERSERSGRVLGLLSVQRSCRS